MAKFFPPNDNYFLTVDSDRRKELLNMMNSFENITSKAYWLESKIGYLSCILTFLQLIILTRKSMMTSSINSLMIGVSICDHLSMLILILLRNPLDNDDEMICQAPMPLSSWDFLFYVRCIRLYFRRCSCWFGVIMAVFRYSIIKSLKSSKKLASTKFGFKVVLGTCLALSILLIGSFFEYSNYQIKFWIPPIECTQYPPGTFLPIYQLDVSELFLKWNGLLLMLYENLDGVLSKFIPSLLLPTLTVLLLVEVRKSNKVNVLAGASSSLESKKKSDRTTFLVILMSITFFISEFPLSISSFLRSVYSNNPAIDRIGELIYYTCNSIFTINASIHCIIYFSMSSQYRNTVAVLLRIQKKESPNQASNVGQAMTSRM